MILGCIYSLFHLLIHYVVVVVVHNFVVIRGRFWNVCCANEFDQADVQVFCSENLFEFPLTGHFCFLSFWSSSELYIPLSSCNLNFFKFYWKIISLVLMFHLSGFICDSRTIMWLNLGFFNWSLFDLIFM